MEHGQRVGSDLSQAFQGPCACGLIGTALPVSALAIRRIRQRVKMGGHSIPEADVRRRFTRSLDHFLKIHAPLTDGWTFRDKSTQPATLLFDSANSTLQAVRQFLGP
jgi:predicted ABC-type ATPase